MLIKVLTDGLNCQINFTNLDGIIDLLLQCSRIESSDDTWWNGDVVREPAFLPFPAASAAASVPPSVYPINERRQRKRRRRRRRLDGAKSQIGEWKERPRKSSPPHPRSLAAFPLAFLIPDGEKFPREFGSNISGCGTCF